MYTKAVGIGLGEAGISRKRYITLEVRAIISEKVL